MAAERGKTETVLMLADCTDFGVMELFPISVSSNLWAIRRSSLWWKPCKLYQCPTAPRYLKMSTAPMRGSRAPPGAHKLSHGQRKTLKDTHWTQSVRRALKHCLCWSVCFSDRILSKQAGLEFKSSLTQFPKGTDAWIPYMHYGTQFWTRYLFENTFLQTKP